MKPQRQKKRQIPAGEKIFMLICVITSIEKSYIVMRPLKRIRGVIEGSITCSKENIFIEGDFNIGDEVSAFKLFKGEKGWRSEEVRKLK